MLCTTCSAITAGNTAILFLELQQPSCGVDMLQRNIWRADKGMTVDLSAMNAVRVDAVKHEISVQGEAVCMLKATLGVL